MVVALGWTLALGELSWVDQRSWGDGDALGLGQRDLWLGSELEVSLLFSQLLLLLHLLEVLVELSIHILQIRLELEEDLLKDLRLLGLPSLIDLGGLATLLLGGLLVKEVLVLGQLEVGAELVQLACQAVDILIQQLVLLL